MGSRARTVPKFELRSQSRTEQIIICHNSFHRSYILHRLPLYTLIKHVELIFNVRTSQADARSKHSEGCVRTLQIKYDALMRTHEEVRAEYELVLKRQKTPLGQNMECVLAYLVRKLVDGSHRGATRHNHLHFTYQLQKSSTHLLLTSIVQQLQSSEAALSALLDLASPGLPPSHFPVQLFPLRDLMHD